MSAKAGRPLKFETPAELENKIQEYFETCDAGEDVESVSKRGELIKYRRQIPYTVEGLSLHLDCTRETLNQYGKQPGYSDLISRARRKIYDSWLKRGLVGEYNPRIVALCLAAHNEEYRVNQQHDIVVKSTEDRLRQIHVPPMSLTDYHPNQGAFPGKRDSFFSAGGRCGRDIYICTLKLAETQIGVGTATVTRELANKINENAALGDRVSGNALRSRVQQMEGVKCSN